MIVYIGRSETGFEPDQTPQIIHKGKKNDKKYEQIENKKIRLYSKINIDSLH